MLSKSEFERNEDTDGDQMVAVHIYYTFVYDGPIFKDRIDHQLGEIVLRDGRFYYCDILPV